MTEFPVATATPLLAVKNLEVVYNRAVTAIQGVSFAVAERSITALIGTNGAGKTTTLSALAGFMRADDVQITQGDILLRGRSIRGQQNFQINALGISLVPEREKVFATMSVEDNLLASRSRSAAGELMTLDEVYALFPKLTQRRRSHAGYLSGGERQMLAIAMAMLSRPALIMIDELSLGLAPVVVEQIQGVIRHLRDAFGIAFLIVEQNATSALELADYTYVVENGRIVFDGTRERLLSHGDFREFYLGIEKAGDQKSYRDVKQYRRKRRWFG